MVSQEYFTDIPGARLRLGGSLWGRAEELRLLTFGGRNPHRLRVSETAAIHAVKQYQRLAALEALSL